MPARTKNLSRSAQIVVCAPARVLRHFCDDRIAGEEAGDDVAPKVVEWIIEGRDDPLDSERVVLDAGTLVHHQHACLTVLRREALFSGTDGPLNLFARRENLPKDGVDAGLSGITARDGANVLLLANDKVKHHAKNTPALGERGVPPRLLRLLRLGDEVVDVIGVHVEDLTEMAARRGVVALQMVGTVA